MNRQAVFKKNKAVNAILYVAHKQERSDIDKICKILYFADQKSLSECGRSSTGDTYSAARESDLFTDYDKAAYLSE